MPIQQVTPTSEINEFIERKLQTWTKLLVRNFSIVGERVLNAARSTDSYKDKTGNLRSSLGYVVVVDGKVATQSSFEVVKNGQEGAISGREYARKLAKKYPHGIVLIACAGMNYAAYVSAKGYDVEDSAELLADRLVPQMLHELGLR